VTLVDVVMAEGTVKNKKSTTDQGGPQCSETRCELAALAKPTTYMQQCQQTRKYNDDKPIA